MYLEGLVAGNSQTWSQMCGDSGLVHSLFSLLPQGVAPTRHSVNICLNSRMNQRTERDGVN